MNKQELAILEKAFAAEVSGALSAHGIHVLQSKSKIAVKLWEEGYLRPVQTDYKGVIITGYELTHLGRLTYCSSI